MTAGFQLAIIILITMAVCAFTYLSYRFQSVQLRCFHVKTADVGRLLEIDHIQKSCHKELNVYIIGRTSEQDSSPNIIFKCMVGNSQEKPNSSG